MSWIAGPNALALARVWHEVSAKGESVGRLAARIATVLMGKHKPIMSRCHDCGDYVIVTDIEQIALGGKKDLYREYRSHTGRKGGGMRREFARDLRKIKPDVMLRHAVSGMLPKNSFRWPRLQRLRTFVGSDHPYKRNLLRQYDYGDPEPPETNPFAPEKTLVLSPQDQLQYGVERITYKSSSGTPAFAKPYGRPNWYNSRYSKLKTTNQVKKRPEQRTRLR